MNPVAADVSPRALCRRKFAPTHVGGYEVREFSNALSVPRRKQWDARDFGGNKTRGTGGGRMEFSLLESGAGPRV